MASTFEPCGLLASLKHRSSGLGVTGAHADTHVISPRTAPALTSYPLLLT